MLVPCSRVDYIITYFGTVGCFMPAAKLSGALMSRYLSHGTPRLSALIRFKARSRVLWPRDSDSLPARRLDYIVRTTISQSYLASTPGLEHPRQVPTQALGSV